MHIRMSCQGMARAKCLQTGDAGTCRRRTVPRSWRARGQARPAPPSAQATHAQAAGAAAVLVVNNDDTGFFRMDQEAGYAGAAVTIPVGGMPQVGRARRPPSGTLWQIWGRT